ISSRQATDSKCHTRSCCRPSSWRGRAARHRRRADAHMGALAIESFDVTAVAVPLAREYRGSHYRMTNRSTVIVRVATREGIIGEAYAGDEDAALGEIVRVIRDELAPRLLGEDAFAIERCWQKGFPVTFDVLRDRRIGLVALAAVDFALWDAIGKALDRPLWQLWGGYRDSIAVNIIGGYYGRDLDGIRDEVSEWRGMGLHGCKVKICAKEPREDASRLEAARAPFGPAITRTVATHTASTRV